MSSAATKSMIWFWGNDKTRKFQTIAANEKSHCNYRLN